MRIKRIAVAALVAVIMTASSAYAQSPDTVFLSIDTEAAKAEITVNGLPVYENEAAGPVSHSASLNFWLKPTGNVVDVQVESLEGKNGSASLSIQAGEMPLRRS